MVEISSLGCERLGSVGIAFGVEVGRPGRCHDGLLIQSLTLQVGPKVDLVRPGGGELALGFERLQLHIGVGELQEYGLRRDLLARLGQALVDSARGDGGDPSDPLRNQGTGPPHLDHQWTTLY
jgi:hypothetical protein